MAETAPLARRNLASGVDQRPLHSGFLRSLAQFPDRPAVEASGVILTYEQLYGRAAAIAACLDRVGSQGESPLTAVFAYRTPTAFAGVLAALLRGHGYVPLNRTYPSRRTADMLRRSGCRAVIVDAESVTNLEPVIAELDYALTLVFPDSADVSVLSARWPQHIVLGARDLVAPPGWSPRDAAPGSIAYLLFTSGSTGVPKGVMVAHSNVRHFLDRMVDRYRLSEHDRLSQTFDMTFDLSVFDIFMAWETGACVCCLPQSGLLQPGRFIQESRLTLWFSVPSLGVLMRRLGMLKPGRYPDLRWSLFCGEPLPVEIATSWAEAAPNSVVENLYGPTELTIACMAYRWDPARSPEEARFSIVPIGDPYPGMDALVADAELHEVDPGAEGELLLTGPQVTLGYWQDVEKTQVAFVTPAGKKSTYYRTGDLVRAPVEGEPMRYLGRIDHQIKINGHRVELGEVEATLREICGASEAVALGWPRTESGASGVVAFIRADQIDVRSVRDAVAEKLPDYMVPRKILAIEELPLNVNGKYDRDALVRRLEEGA